MKVNFTARQTMLTREVKNYCEKRLKSLQKLLGRVIEMDIILSVEKTRQRAEIHVKAKGTNLIVEEETHDMVNSLNLAFESLEKKLKKEREKNREKKRRQARVRKPFRPPAETAEPERRVIQSEDYSLKPMSLEEALLQFDAQKRDVFAFRKLGSEKWAFIFRRKDGNYGLIEPE